MLDRREWIRLLGATGIGTATFHRAATALAAGQDGLTKDSLLTAAWITDFDLSDEDAESILRSVKRSAAGLKQLREVKLAPFLGPAFRFQPLVSRTRVVKPVRTQNWSESLQTQLPDSEVDIAFSTVGELAHFIRTRQITSRRLTEIYLGRLRKFGPMLRSVVNLTEELALQQADQADSEIANGKYRGPLHGVPWGAKDLIDVQGYPTTWGIPVHKDRRPDESATVYQRLTDAGAVLVAKLSLGAIAMGDKWYKGRTRNPWNPRTGSSGSSAGSASATSAGLVGFSLGSETLGSITSPSKVCGSTGFRPTFGRVSRHGCMPLSWTMDKVGPICRSALDCAMVFSAIHGADGKDLMAHDVDFRWPDSMPTSGLKIAYPEGTDIEKRKELKILKELGCQLIAARLPMNFPLYSLAEIIDVEAASVFDELLREGKTEGWNTWPRSFRSAQFISAIDYLRFMRLRTQLMKEMEQFMSQFDFIVNLSDVFHTNLTGHPSIVLPLEFKTLKDGAYKPVPVTISGHLDDDARLLAFAEIVQRKINNNRQPELEPWLAKYSDGTLDQVQSDESNSDSNSSGS